MREDVIALTISGSSLVGTNLSSSFNSDAFNLFGIYAYSIQIAWTGGTAPVGTFTLQGSNDPANSNILLNKNAPTNWTTITGSSQAISGTPGNILYDVTQCSYRWTRVVYTATSGSAPITAANLQVKGPS